MALDSALPALDAGLPALDAGLTLTQDPALPQWPSAAALAAVVEELRGRPPLVRFDDCLALRDRLAAVSRGDAIVVQAGDCAEMFDEVSARTTARKRSQLDDLARVAGRGIGLPVLRVGRIAGQFGKPRSAPVEPGPDGLDIPVYRGDAVNGADPSPAGRVPDPRRMLTAYDRSATVLRDLAGRRGRPVWTSHEALLCEYEEAMVRRVRGGGTTYDSSAHLLWIGDRTRQAHGPHLALLAAVANPVAVKLGPTATPDDVVDLVDRLDPHREPGRLVLVPRLGAARVARQLGGLVRAARRTGSRPVWLCDPMHANTLRTGSGRKTRAVEDVVSEVLGFVAALRAVGEHPGGVHLEVSPDDVTECVDRRTQAAGTPALPRYRTACDPRLNATQAELVVATFARAVAA